MKLRMLPQTALWKSLYSSFPESPEKSKESTWNEFASFVLCSAMYVPRKLLSNAPA